MCVRADTQGHCVPVIVFCRTTSRLSGWYDRGSAITSASRVSVTSCFLLLFIIQSIKTLNQFKIRRVIDQDDQQLSLIPWSEYWSCREGDTGHIDFHFIVLNSGFYGSI